MEGVKVINKVSVKLFSFFNGEIIGDQEHVFSNSWSRTSSNYSASLMRGFKDVSVKLFSSFKGWCIGDQERVCQTFQLL